MPATTPVQLQLKNILVPVDFSPRSEVAVKLAKALAEYHGSVIHVANVVESLDVSGMSTDARRKIDANHPATDFRSIETDLSGVSHATILLDGEVNACLHGAIKDRDIDLVVMATQGAAGCERLLMGSVTEELFREARCPVLVIGPRCTQDFRRFASFETILYPMEMTPSSIAAIPHVIALADERGATVTLLHVAHSDIQSASERQRIRERVGSEMKRLFPKRLLSSIDTIVEFGPITETITEFAMAKHADVVVLGVRSGGAFTRSATHIPWSIAHRIVAEAPCPVLTVRND